MKTYYKTLIIGLCAVMVVLVGIMAFFISVGDSGFHSGFTFGKQELVKTHNLPVAGITEMMISYGPGDIFFREGSGNEVVIKEYGPKDLEKQELAIVQQTGETVQVRNGKYRNQYFLFSSSYNDYRYLEIYLPSDYSHLLQAETTSGDIDSNIDLRLKKVAFHTSSGDITLGKLDAGDVTLQAVSGDIHASGADGHNVVIDTSSGAIRIDYIKATDIEIHSVSGDIGIPYVEGNKQVTTSSGEIQLMDGSGESIVNTVSGDITIKNMTGNQDVSSSSGSISVFDLKGFGLLKSVSGDIRVDFQEVKGDIKVESSSGSVNLSLPANTAFDFKAESVSGEINTFFDQALSFNKRNTYADGKVGAEPTKKVEITTTSGDIRVSKS